MASVSGESMKPSRSVWRHGVAVAYAIAAGLLVVRWGADVGPSTYFGTFYPVLIEYPLFFWMLTACYAGLAVRGLGWPAQQTLANTVGLGLLVHINFLSLSLLADDATLTRLAVPYFVLYARGVLAAIIVVANTVGVLIARSALRGTTSSFSLPLAYLPLATIAFGPLIWTLPLSAASGAAGFVVSRAAVSRGAYGLWSKTKAHLADPRMFAVAVFLLALAMRLTASMRLAGMGVDTVMLNSDDATQYDANAMGLVSGAGVLGSQENPALSNYSAGYSLFLAALYGLFGRSMSPVLGIQAVMASFVPLALYWVGRRSCGETAARVAAVLAALSQLLIFNSANLTREMLSLVLVLPMVGLLQSAVPFGVLRHRALAGAGMLLGLLILVDPMFILVGIAVSIACGLRASGPSWRRVAPALVIWCAVYATAIPLKHLVVSPVTMSEHMSLTTRPTRYAIHVSKDYNLYAQELYDRGINPFAYGLGSIVNAVRDPVDVLRLEANKVWLDFRRFLFEGNSGLFFPLLLVIGSYFSGNIFFYATLSAFVGFGALVRLARRDGRAGWQAAVPLLVLVAYAAPYIILIFGSTRYRATMQPLILLLVGLGISTVAAWVMPQFRSGLKTVTGASPQSRGTVTEPDVADIAR